MHRVSHAIVSDITFSREVRTAQPGRVIVDLPEGGRNTKAVLQCQRESTLYRLSRQDPMRGANTELDGTDDVF